MKTPFEILEIDDSLSDTQIKAAYLKMVRRFPPDRSPDQFKEIKEAYDGISTWKKRLSYRLFHVIEPDMDTLFRSVMEEKKERIKAALFFKLISDLAREEMRQVSSMEGTKQH